MPHSESAMEEGSSPVSALGITRSLSSPSLHDTSTSSTHSSIRSDLNQGFIDPDATSCLDATVTSADPLVVARGRSLKRGDSFRPGERPVRRSASTDGPLRRGQPNKLNNGLLEGKAENVRKLRRSFDKSDIGHPIPLIVPVLPEKPAAEREREAAAAGSRPSDFAWESSAWHDTQPPGAAPGRKHSVMVTAEKVRVASSSSSSDSSGERSVDMESSLLRVVLPPPSGFGDQSMMEVDHDGNDGGGDNSDDDASDEDSEAGFSTISGGTVIHNPAAAAGLLSLQQKGEDGRGRALPRGMACYGSSVSVTAHTLSLQPSTSVDSLISTGSQASTSSYGSTQPGGARALDRSVSMDSGKGSLVDGAEVQSSSTSSRSLDATFVKSCVPPLEGRARGGHPQPEPASSFLYSANRSIKSLSAEDLKSETRAERERPPARAHSMYAGPAAGSGSGSGLGSGSGRHHHVNAIPNLQISAETHRLLTRAGFLDGSLPPNIRDVAVPFKSPQKNSAAAVEGHSFSRDERLARSFRLERSERYGSGRKDRSSALHSERVSPVKEETAAAAASSADQAETIRSSTARATTTLEARGAEAMEEEVWVRRRETPPLLAEPTCQAAAAAAEKRGVVEERGVAPMPSVNLKRAELRMQKHESVLHMKQSNAGRVAQNVQQFNSSLDRSALSDPPLPHSAPLHPPHQSCAAPPPRKRGKSPVRIPTIFAKTAANDPSAAYYRELAQRAHRKDGPSFPEVTAKPGNNRSAAEEPSELELGSTEGDPAQNVATEKKEDADAIWGETSRLLKRRQAARSSMGAAAGIDLSASLLETIEDVVTPQHPRRREGARSPLQESTNTKQSVAAAGLEDRLPLRTSKGLTPHQVVRYGSKVASSERSPGKAVKRLQHSPRSPHAAGRQSPHRRSSPQKSAGDRDSLRLESCDFHGQY